MIFDFIISGAPLPRMDRHKLGGVVTIDGVPSSRLVVVQDRETFELYAAVWSVPVTGAWHLYGMEEYPERSLMVLSQDHTGAYNAEIADYISQVA